MKQLSRGPWLAFGAILAWRLALVVFTAQPIPSNDAFFFDGAMVNWLRHDGYFNPSIALASGISGREVFSAYPPGYQLVLLPWLALFGTSALSAIALHLTLVTAAAAFVVRIVTAVFPGTQRLWLAVLLLLAITFSDRPDSLGHLLGLGAVWLAIRRTPGESPRVGAWAGIMLLLVATVFTSPVGGAFYTGVLFVTFAANSWIRRERFPAWAFGAVVLLCAGIIFAIRRTQPQWWAGFLENGQQSAMHAGGLHLPDRNAILKLVRSAPMFGLFVACLPFLLMRCWRRNDPSGQLPLTLGVGVVGLGVLAASGLLSSPNYCAYVLFSQVILAAGLLSWAATQTGMWRRLVSLTLVCGVMLVSIRAVGMSTWGVRCARDVSLSRANGLVQEALQPAAAHDDYAIVSSAFLYEAARIGVKRALHTDWLHGRGKANTTTDAEVILRLRPTRIVLTQFDYYRNYQETIEQVRQQTNVVELEIRNTAGVRSPDSFPSFQRVVQHVSWAPVIVELRWK